MVVTNLLLVKDHQIHGETITVVDGEKVIMLGETQVMQTMPGVKVITIIRQVLHKWKVDGVILLRIRRPNWLKPQKIKAGGIIPIKKRRLKKLKQQIMKVDGAIRMMLKIITRRKHKIQKETTMVDGANQLMPLMQMTITITIIIIITIRIIPIIINARMLSMLKKIMKVGGVKNNLQNSHQVIWKKFNLNKLLMKVDGVENKPKSRFPRKKKMIKIPKMMKQKIKMRVVGMKRKIVIKTSKPKI